MKFFLFHCWGGDGVSCWSGWLQTQLRSKGIDGVSPTFPNTKNPRLSEWLAEARHQVPKFEPGDNWVLVGHSLGCPTILRLLESFDENEHVHAVILVAAFAKDLEIPQVKSFVEKKFDWQKIKQKADKFIVINSDNDPFIQLGEGERIANHLNADFIVEHGAGHINEASGYSKYERLREIISKL